MAVIAHRPMRPFVRFRYAVTFMRLVALDWVNFLLADVRGGLGAYVNVYLLTDAHWSQATIGAVLTVSGLTGIMLHPLVGAWIDKMRGKRALLIASTVVLSVCGLAVVWAPTIPVVLAADITMAVLGGVFAPVVAAITVGVVSRDALPARLGRNAIFDRVGNVFMAVVMGIFGTIYSQGTPFFLLPVFAALAIVAVLAIPARAIDHERARGLAMEDTGALRRPESWRVLFRSRPLVVFAVAAAIFHFANGPLLLLVAQKLALAHAGYETGLTSAAIIITQLATIPMALLVTSANALGRKPLVIIAFAAVPLRGLLCASSDNPSWLLGVQLLDGVGAGMYDALLPLLLADMMRGTGRYSLARGALGTIQGIGGSTGFGAAGFIVAAFSYNAAFLTLAAVAVIALLVMVVAMPETRPTTGKLDQPPPASAASSNEVRDLGNSTVHAARMRLGNQSSPRTATKLWQNVGLRNFRIRAAHDDAASRVGEVVEADDLRAVVISTCGKLGFFIRKGMSGTGVT